MPRPANRGPGLARIGSATFPSDLSLTLSLGDVQTVGHRFAPVGGYQPKASRPWRESLFADQVQTRDITGATRPPDPQS